LSRFAGAGSRWRRDGKGGAVRVFSRSMGIEPGRNETEIGSNGGLAANGLRQSRGTRAKCTASESKKQG
jgi:hypothetical protein